MIYGYQLVLDANSGSQKLNDYTSIKNLLNSIPHVISMTPISKPFITVYDGGSKKDEYGISGVILIAESHISIHTYPGKGYFNMDVFSCRKFDYDKAIGFVMKELSVSKISVNKFERGENIWNG